MAIDADLEIGLHRRDAQNYSVELRFTNPTSDGEVRLLREGAPTVTFDLVQLRQLELDAAQYGAQLGANLFGEAAVGAALAQVRAVAQSQNVPLRVRILIGPSAPELHTLRWETLRVPGEESFLAMHEQIRVSRYLSSFDWQPVRLRPQAELRVLMAAANPDGLDGYGLSAVDVVGELARARQSLLGLRITELAPDGKVTLPALVDHLRTGYDILYLVCHGVLNKGTPWLWLADEQGAACRVAGRDLVNQLSELAQRPALIVLAACQSAGAGTESRSNDGGALAALGPQLAEAGVAAVLAMQGNITQQTVATFMPRFFTELRSDGQVDRAVAVARGTVRQQPDWWAPTLFMRLRSGRIWYQPGFTAGRPELEQWQSLLRNIARQRCTPILGPGLSESLLGARRSVAQRWAETYHFPMEPHERDDLPQVAQYVAVNHGHDFLRDELEEYLRKEILDRYGDLLAATPVNAPLDDLISAAVASTQKLTPLESPHQLLAKLPLPLYITTEPSRRMSDALAAAGKAPVVELCRWNAALEPISSIYDHEPNFRPTVECPLVYHLFGRIGEPDSVVLTEDDYFDYLIGVTSDNELIPEVVRRALVDTALLFLGFRLDEWDFRVLFRSIVNREGRARRHSYAHVAVQIDPEEGRILDPERARRYLESYFEDADISIFWGSTEDFIDQLSRRWQAAQDDKVTR